MTIASKKTAGRFYACIMLYARLSGNTKQKRTEVNSLARLEMSEPASLVGTKP